MKIIQEEMKSAIAMTYLEPGENLETVSKRFGFTSKVIRRVLREMKICIKSRSESTTEHFATEAQKKQIVSLYLTGETQQEISAKMSIKDWMVHRVLKNAGIKLMTRSEYTSTFRDNTNFFEKIDSHEKAHILGFIFADGYIKEDANKLQLDVSSKDIEYLNKVRDMICPERPIKILDRGAVGMARLNVTNQKMINDLKRFGLHQAKSLTLKWPVGIPDEFINSFVLGYFDGDGCITKNSIGDYRVEWLSTEEFLKDLSFYLQKILIKQPKISKKGKIHKIQIGGNLQIIKICQWMYKNSELFLSRKKTRYEELSARY